jgi:DNA-binding transcriptional regulator LsrR (DeoR family)
LGVSPEADLARIPDVIGVAFDVAKAQATVAALRSKLVGSIITHSSLARELVRLADQ